MIDFKINIFKNMKALKYIVAIIAILFGAIYMFYFYNVKEGLTQQEECMMPQDIINTAIYENVGKPFYESKTPLSGNCYWPVEPSGNTNKKEFKYCPLICPESAKCASSMDCSKSVGAFFDNITTSKNNWVIKVRDNISNNIQKTLTNVCELSYNACASACNTDTDTDVSCRNACDDIRNTCEYKVLPGFIPNAAENTTNSSSQPVNQYNSGSVYYQQNSSGAMNSQNPFNNTDTGDSFLKYGLGGGLQGIQGGINPITGKIISPEDFNSQSNILSAEQDSASPFRVFKQYLKNLVKEVNDDSSVGIGRVPNNSNPFLCDYIKSSASPASQSYIQSNPANQTYSGYSAGIAPFF